MTTQAVQTLRDKTHAIGSAAKVFRATANAALAEKFSPQDADWPDEAAVPDW